MVQSVCVCMCVCVFFFEGVRGGGDGGVGAGVRLRKDELAHNLNEASTFKSGLPKAYITKP